MNIINLALYLLYEIMIYILVYYVLIIGREVLKKFASGSEYKIQYNNNV